MLRFDTVILGAGASGLFCAAEAARRGMRVVVLERNAKPGRKILVSGGGRANFTNLHAGPGNYVSANAHFCKSALARFTPADFIARVRAAGIPFREKKHGQLFCERTAADLLGLLLDDCRRHGAKILTDRDVGEVRHEGDFFVTAGDETFVADKLVVATGGLSLPKVGATDLGLRLARQFGHAVTATDPALCGFRLDGSLAGFCAAHTGLSCAAAVATPAATFHEDILFTHWGVSGPAMLQASLYWNPGETVRLRLCPPVDWFAYLCARQAAGDRRACRAAVQEHLPARLAEGLFAFHRLPDPELANLARRDARRIADALERWEIRPKDWIGWDRAEVTRGGVAVAQISSRTMESRRQPGLYFIGEVLDVTGQLGGFNFQWAWASGIAAAEGMEPRIPPAAAPKM